MEKKKLNELYLCSDNIDTNYVTVTSSDVKLFGK